MEKLPPAEKPRPLFGRRDWIWLLLILAMAGAFWLYTSLRSGEELTAVLWVDGEPRLALPLSDPPSGSVSLTAYGVDGYLEAEPGRIRFAHMDCPDKICEKAGWLSEENQTAACMPNKVSLTLLPAGQVPELS